MIFNNATNMMLGASEVSRVMCGSAKVWERSTPDAYREIEYIKSTGTQYIVTDIVPTFTDTAVMDVQPGSNYRVGDFGALFGVYSNNDTLGGSFSALLDNTPFLAMYVGFVWDDYPSQSSSFGGRIPNATDRAVITLSRTRNSSYVRKSDGYNLSWDISSLQIVEPAIKQPLTILGAYYSYESINPNPTNRLAPYTLYSFKMYDVNNALTHDLVPTERVRDGAAGLYDRVTGKFYGNAGTGEFVKGGYV